MAASGTKILVRLSKRTKMAHLNSDKVSLTPSIAHRRIQSEQRGAVTAQSLIVLMKFSHRDKKQFKAIVIPIKLKHRLLFAVGAGQGNLCDRFHFLIDPKVPKKEHNLHLCL